MQFTAQTIIAAQQAQLEAINILQTMPYKFIIIAWIIHTNENILQPIRVYGVVSCQDQQ